MAVTSGSRAAAVPPLPALAPEAVLAALEALAPQARPYNFDDRFDCWGLVREVYGRLLPGMPLDDDLDDATAVETERVQRWAPITEMAELLPGDVVTTHDHHAPGEFHAVIVYGRVSGRLLVYDSSPRGDVPLFEEREGELVFLRARELHTRVHAGHRGAPIACATTAGRTCDSGSSVGATTTAGSTTRCSKQTRGARPTPSRCDGARVSRPCPSMPPAACRPTVAAASSTTTAPPVVSPPTCPTGRRCPTTTISAPATKARTPGGRRPAPPALVAAPAAAHPGGAARLRWSYRPETRRARRDRLSRSRCTSCGAGSGNASC